MRDYQTIDLRRRPPYLAAAGLVAIILASTGAVLTSRTPGGTPSGPARIEMVVTTPETPVSSLGLPR